MNLSVEQRRYALGAALLLTLAATAWVAQREEKAEAEGLARPVAGARREAVAKAATAAAGRSATGAKAEAALKAAK